MEEPLEMYTFWPHRQVCWAIFFGGCIALVSFWHYCSSFDDVNDDLSVVRKEEEKPKLQVDPAKRLAQNVKFVVRLKRRMKEFKKEKEKRLLQECHQD